jgi:uncharacterized protein (TIGR03435 family)
MRFTPATIVLLDRSATSPSLYTALQEQSAMKLQLQQLSVDSLVIDQAERPVEH